MSVEICTIIADHLQTQTKFGILYLQKKRQTC